MHGNPGIGVEAESKRSGKADGKESIRYVYLQIFLAGSYEKQSYAVLGGSRGILVFHRGQPGIGKRISAQLWRLVF